MKRKYLALGLALSIGASSITVWAQEETKKPQVISEKVDEEMGSIHQINMEAPITKAEFVISVLKGATDDKPLPPIMDTHYARPAMEKADELGLINLEEHPMETWSKIISNEEKSMILTKAMQNNGIDIGKVYTVLSQVLLNDVTVEGEKVDLEGLTMSHSNGEVMMPLRPVAEAMGFKVTWDGPSYTATLNNGQVESKVQVGFDSYSYTSVEAIGMSAPFSVGAAPRLIEGTMYVPAKYFELFATLATSDNTLQFTMK